MSAVLSWASTSGAVIFTVFRGGQTVPIDEWSVHPQLDAMSGGTAHPGLLIRLVADGEASQPSLSTVSVPLTTVAALSPGELAALGLPPASPYGLEVTSSGLITDSQFSVTTRFIRADGKPLLGVRRSGLFIEVGERRYTLLDPAFTISEAAARLNATTNAGDKLAALADLQSCLPADAIVGNYLKQIRVVRADSPCIRSALRTAAFSSIQSR